jgi:CDP-glucose 4,6-dehydratase
VTDVVGSLVAGQPVPVRRPMAIRPWQHVLQALSGYLGLAARMLQSDDPRWSSAWNFGPLPGSESSVGRLLEMFLAAWEEGSWEDQSSADQPYEDHALRLNIEKSVALLGWRPCWGLEETVRRTARWYRQFYRTQGGPMLAACLEDIDAYEQAMNTCLGQPAGEPPSL